MQSPSRQPYVVDDLKRQLDTSGLIGPFSLSEPEALEDVSKAALSAQTDSSQRLQDRHVDVAGIWKTLRDPSMLKIIGDCFGSGTKLWRSNFFIKSDGSGEVGWHHDKHFQNGDAPLNLADLNDHFSILVAVTDINADDGVFEYIPGTHKVIEALDRDLRPYHMRPTAEHFLNLPDQLLGKAVKLPLKRGEFALFHSALLHRSHAFEQGGVRISLIGRLAKSHVSIPAALATSAVIVDYN